MSKYHKIRWNQSDTKELERVVRNFNAKINRLSKNNPQIKESLPERVSVRELKQLINTRQDLKRELNALQRFSKRGNEQLVDVPDNDYNLKITKWQKTEMNRRIAIINRKRKARLEELENTEMTSRGQKLGYTRGQLGMGKVTEVQLKPMNAFYRTMGRTDLKKRWKSILNQSQSDYFTKQDYAVRDNYLKGLKENYDWESIKDVYEHIEKMDIKEFLSTFEEEGGTFEFASPDGQLDLKHQDYQGYETALRSTWLPNRK